MERNQVVPFDLHWDDDNHTILRIDIHGDSTWAQQYEVVDEAVEALQGVAYRLDVIVHTIGQLPPGDPIPHLKDAISKLRACPNLGLVVIVNRRTFYRSIVELVLRLYSTQNQHHGGFVDSLDEARQIIAKSRANAA